jgi:methionyl-tRNA formyltransferase
MALEEGLDTGPVYARAEVAIDQTTTAAALRDELVSVGSRLLVDTLARPLTEPTPQTGTPTYARKIDPGELRIDWRADSSDIDRLVRLGGAWTTFRGRRLKIHVAEIVEHRLVPLVVQPEGKAQMAYEAWRNGAQPEPGEWFV